MDTNVYYVPMPRDEFIQLVISTVKKSESTVWERANPDFLDLKKIAIQNETLMVYKTHKSFGSRIQITGSIRAEMIDNNNETKIIAQYFPNTGFAKFLTWAASIISTLICLPLMIFDPSISVVVVYVLIQIAAVIIRFIIIQEGENELRIYFSQILRKITR
ncbi:MAG: hypothetical protein E6Q41_04070 [Cyclobacteriaceae bacterium]|nr:MAG: hypothetical protein E6Q41_04070 [Cyclobacteriaceae bacterium]